MEVPMRKITYREAVIESLREEMKRDPSVYLLGEDIAEFGGSYKTTVGLLQEFGKERVRNTPISEAAIIGCALGSALLGMRPVAELMYVDFRASPWIRSPTRRPRSSTCSAARPRCRSPSGRRAAPAAPRGPACPEPGGLVPSRARPEVVMPSNAYDLKGLLKASIRDDNPVIFIEHKLLYATTSEIPDEEYLIPWARRT